MLMRFVAARIDARCFAVNSVIATSLVLGSGVRADQVREHAIDVGEVAALGGTLARTSDETIKHAVSSAEASVDVALDVDPRDDVEVQLEDRTNDWVVFAVPLDGALEKRLTFSRASISGVAFPRALLDAGATRPVTPLPRTLRRGCHWRLHHVIEFAVPLDRLFHQQPTCAHPTLKANAPGFRLSQRGDRTVFTARKMDLRARLRKPHVPQPEHTPCVGGEYPPRFSEVHFVPKCALLLGFHAFDF